MNQETLDLKEYYTRLFPTKNLYRWLLNSEKREYSFTYNSNVYVRAQSFHSACELETFLQSKPPEKIDVGAVYTSSPKVGTEYHPVQKELVFDIDLTDYTRKCCEGKTICDSCFTLVKCGAHLMNYYLNKTFGFEKLLFVFSGGRGLHVWVSDESARFLDDKERKGIVEYINLTKMLGDSKLLEKRLDPEVLEILNRYSYFLKEQNIQVPLTVSNLIEFLYVKLDVNVSTDMKHLLKSPFSIHQTTKRVSVPIPIDKFDDLKVEELPTLNQILFNYSLFEPYVQYFDEYVSQNYN